MDSAGGSPSDAGAGAGDARPGARSAARSGARPLTRHDAAAGGARSDHDHGALRLIVLAKPPLPGRCKSRLAAGVGVGPATRLARAMLQDVWTAACAFAASPGREQDRARAALACCDDHEPSGVTALLATCDEAGRYPLLLPGATTTPQGEGDLGQRMARLVAEHAADGAGVVLLGTDSPALPPEHLRAALAALDDHDLVLGPARNGGFWCLAARPGHPTLADPTWLDDLDWSDEDTLPAVTTRAISRGLRVGRAPYWFDVDHAEDLATLAAAVEEQPQRAPRVARLLRDDPALARLAGGTPAAQADTAAQANTAAQAETAALADTAALVSFIVPTLDEGLELDRALERLRLQPGPIELIVADGGSTDGSVDRALAADDVSVVAAPRGRGAQLAAGAALATGAVLAFPHVDTRLPDDAAQRLRAALLDGDHEAAAFVTRTVADPSVPDRAGPLLRLADLRSRLTRHPYGDQCLAVRAEVYAEIGGFAPLPIMEDYDLSVRLAARAPIARLRPAVTVSGRGMQQRPLKAALLMRVIPPLYRLGVSPQRLARLYRGG